MKVCPPSLRGMQPWSRRPRKYEFAQLLGAQALFGIFITLTVTETVQFLGKMNSHLW